MSVENPQLRYENIGRYRLETTALGNHLLVKPGTSNEIIQSVKTSNLDEVTIKPQEPTSEIYSALATLSIQEREAHWASSNLTNGEQYTTWREQTVSAIKQTKFPPDANIKKEFYEKLGHSITEALMHSQTIDFLNFSNESADALYARYFPEGKSDVYLFVGDVLGSFFDSDSYDDAAYSKIEACKPYIKRLAGMFGPASAEIITVFAQSVAQLKSDPELFVTELHTKTMTQTDQSYLGKLYQQTQPVELIPEVVTQSNPQASDAGNLSPEGGDSQVITSDAQRISSEQATQDERQQVPHAQTETNKSKDEINEQVREMIRQEFGDKSLEELQSIRDDVLFQEKLIQGYVEEGENEEGEQQWRTLLEEKKVQRSTLDEIIRHKYDKPSNRYKIIEEVKNNMSEIFNSISHKVKEKGPSAILSIKKTSKKSSELGKKAIKEAKPLMKRGMQKAIEIYQSKREASKKRDTQLKQTAESQQSDRILHESHSVANETPTNGEVKEKKKNGSNLPYFVYDQMSPTDFESITAKLENEGAVCFMIEVPNGNSEDTTYKIAEIQGILRKRGYDFEGEKHSRNRRYKKRVFTVKLSNLIPYTEHDVFKAREGVQTDDS
jgi:hypothetical protein